MSKQLPQHAVLGASGAHRWRLCAGSVRMEADQPDIVGPPAEIGTAAHDIAAMILKGDMPRDELSDINHWKAPGQKESWPIDATMQEYILVYVDYVNQYATKIGIDPLIEVRFSLAPINPPGPMYGTADAVLDDVADDHLHIFDLKTGFREVEVIENDQEMYYALGAALEVQRAPSKITLHIIQPSRTPAVSTWTLTWDELVEFKKALFVDAAKTNDPDAPLVPGEKQCQWCSARAVCPALRQHALIAAGDEFAAAPLIAAQEVVLPAAEALTQGQLLEALEKGAIVSAWISGLQEHLDQRVLGGEIIEGYKIVQTSKHRRWANVTKAEEWLRSKRFRVADIKPPKLLSPAQAEKLLKKRKIVLPEVLVSKPEGSYIVVRNSDKRLAITRGEEFTALPAGSGQEEVCQH